MYTKCREWVQKPRSHRAILGMGQLTYLLCSVSMVKAPDHGGFDLFSLHGYPPQLVLQVIPVSWRVHRKEGGGEGGRLGGEREGK